MRYKEFMIECTSSSSVATAITPISNPEDALGVGMNPDGDWGIYDFAKKKQRKDKKHENKPVVIKRNK